VLRNPAVLAENVYNMDEAGVMLSMLGSVKDLVGKGNKQKYRGVRVKRTTVTAVECINVDGRYPNLIITSLATTYWGNWTKLDSYLQRIILHSIINVRISTTRLLSTRVVIGAQREDLSLLFPHTPHNIRHTFNLESRTTCGLIHPSGNPPNCPTPNAPSLGD
jgi:hypothetical protein